MTASTNASTVVHTERDGEPFPLMRLPPELRLEIYRHYFSDLVSSKNSTHTVWSNTAAQSLSLLQTGSQVRREAGPILYEECIGNKNCAKPHSWVLGTSSPQQWLLRLKAMSKSLAQQSPKVEVTIRLVRGVSIPESNNFAALPRQFESSAHALSKGLRLANILCNYLERRLSGYTRAIGKVGGDQSQPCGFTTIFGDVVVAYCYNPAQREEGFSLRGPLATFDWNGLSP